MNLITSGLIFFVIQFSGYYWDPCTSDGNCYAVNGYEVPVQTEFCQDVGCVNKILNERGIEHLDGVYQVSFDKYSIDNGSTATITKLKVEHKLGIKQED
jgi:hypothetical protein